MPATTLRTRSAALPCSGPVDADGAPTRAPGAEAEFIAAIVDYKRSSGRNFPTWSEVLEVALNLGYVKPGETAAAGACGLR